MRLDRQLQGRRHELFWDTGKTRQIPANLRHVAISKLEMLDAAETLADLLVPPGNRLEALSEDRVGQLSIRVNDQLRLCFIWRDGNGSMLKLWILTDTSVEER